MIQQSTKASKWGPLDKSNAVQEVQTNCDNPAKNICWRDAGSGYSVLASTSRML